MSLDSIWPYFEQLDSVFLGFYTVFIFIRAVMYPQDLYHWYKGTYNSEDSGLTSKHFDFMMKILYNKQFHHERPEVRNFLFNTIRCLGYPVYIMLLNNDFSLDNLFTLVRDTAFIAVFSYLVNNNVNRDTWFTNQRLIWSMLGIEHNSMYGLGFLAVMDRTESWFAGNYIAWIVFAVL